MPQAIKHLTTQCSLQGQGHTDVAVLQRTRHIKTLNEYIADTSHYVSECVRVAGYVSHCS